MPLSATQASSMFRDETTRNPFVESVRGTVRLGEDFPYVFKGGLRPPREPLRRPSAPCRFAPGAARQWPPRNRRTRRSPGILTIGEPGLTVEPSTDDYGPPPRWTFGRRAPRRTDEPPAGRASGPPTRNRPPAAGATRPEPSATPGCPDPVPRPIAHRRRPDRARLVQVVRPVGRSTWTRRARPGRVEPARRDAWHR